MHLLQVFEDVEDVVVLQELHHVVIIVLPEAAGSLEEVAVLHPEKVLVRGSFI